MDIVQINREISDEMLRFEKASWLRKQRVKEKTQLSLPAAVPKRWKSVFLVSNSDNIYKCIPIGKNPQRLFLYLFGGAYHAPIIVQQWDFILSLAQRTEAAVWVPMYPLCPPHTARQVFAFLNPIYRAAAKQKLPWIVLGDSAGAGISLSLLQQAKEQNLPLPSGCFLGSPCIQMPGEEEREQEKQDPMLSFAAVTRSLQDFAGELSPHDSRISPLEGRLQGLCPLLAVSGTHDLLWPQTYALQKKVEQEKGTCEAYVFRGLPHCFFCVPSPEQENLLSLLANWIERKT